MCGSNWEEQRCVNPSGKRKGVWIHVEKEKVSGSKEIGSWNIDPNVNILCKVTKLKGIGIQKGKRKKGFLFNQLIILALLYTSLISPPFLFRPLI